MPDYSKDRNSSINPNPTVPDFGIRVAVMLLRAGEVLLVRHDKPDLAPYYVLPGGRLEPGETIPECAVREMLEETGLTVEFEGVIHVNEFLREGRHTVDVTVTASPLDDREAQLGYDPEVAPGATPTLGAVEWVPLPKLHSMTLLPNQIKQKLLSDETQNPHGIYLGSSRG